MTRVTLVEFRRDARGVLRRIERGESLVLTRRGRPVARIEPIRQSVPGTDDPIYRLADLAVEGPGPMTDRDMDRAVYGI